MSWYFGDVMKKLSLFSLVCLIVAAIDSIRNLPGAALFGSSLIFFFLLSALMFLIPVALVSAELGSRYSEEGGVFHWVRNAFGEKVGLLAIWLQWINTMVWYPTILAFMAGTAAYLFDPLLAQSKGFLVSVILVSFWGLTLLNLRGIHVSARVNAFCGMIGTLFPMLLLIGLGIYWIVDGQPVQIGFSWREIIPSLGASNNWVSLIAIMASFLGMELSGVHVKEMDNPQRNFPKAMGISVLILLFTMLFGSLAIAVVIPEREIRLVDGIMQTATQFFDRFHIPASGPVLALLIMVGTFGGMINWLLAPAKGLLQAAERGFLPSFFAKCSDRGVPIRILFAQGVLVSIFCCCFALMPSINAFYWFLTALSTGLYMMMYLLMFGAAWKLGRPKGEKVFQMPRGMRHLACIMGFIACVVTIVVGFVPPEGIDVGTPIRYISSIGLGNIILVAPAALIIFYRKKLGRR